MHSLAATLAPSSSSHKIHIHSSAIVVTTATNICKKVAMLFPFNTQWGSAGLLLGHKATKESLPQPPLMPCPAADGLLPAGPGRHRPAGRAPGQSRAARHSTCGGHKHGCSLGVYAAHNTCLERCLAGWWERDWHCVARQGGSAPGSSSRSGWWQAPTLCRDPPQAALTGRAPLRTCP